MFATPIKNLSFIHCVISSAYRSEERGLIKKTVSSMRSIIRKDRSSDKQMCLQLASAIAMYIYNNSTANKL